MTLLLVFQPPCAVQVINKAINWGERVLCCHADCVLHAMFNNPGFLLSECLKWLPDNDSQLLSQGVKQLLPDLKKKGIPLVILDQKVYQRHDDNKVCVCV